jgi:hypothetical protein
MNDTITIRHSTPGDQSAIERLAVLDGREPPAGSTLLAFAAGELRAALPLVAGEALADPFHPTAELVELLRRRADARRDRGGRRPWRMRLAFDSR